MRVYIDGLGSIGLRHARNISTLCADPVLLVPEHSIHRLEDHPEIVRIPVRDAADAVSKGLDCAIVSSPSASHLDTLEQLVPAQVPIYIEKPVVANRRDLDRLQNLVLLNDYRSPTMVGCNLRFLPAIGRFRSLIGEGEVGPIRRATFEAGQWLPDWRPGRDYRRTYSASAEQGGGAILDLIHEYDIARWIFGEFEEVRSMHGRLSSLEITAEDVVTSILASHGGPIVTVQLDYVSRIPIRRYVATGEEGTLEFHLQEQRLVLHRIDGSSEVFDGPSFFDVGQSYVTAMSEFLAAVD